MNNHEKLKAASIGEYVLDLSQEKPIGTGGFCEVRQRAWLEARGFPPDLFRAVRMAMADLFGEFATDEEIEEYSMDKVWDLLQAAADRRQWLMKAEPARIPPAPFEGWFRITDAANDTGLNKGVISRLLDEGKLKDNGLTGNLRRINPDSLMTYCREHGICLNET